MLPHIKKFEVCNEQLCWLQIESDKLINISLINCYAPTEEKENRIKEDFYSQLDMIHESNPRKKLKLHWVTSMRKSKEKMFLDQQLEKKDYTKNQMVMV